MHDDLIGTGTYSPEDNKLRIYPSTRLPADLYARVKAAGFAWAPKQEVFVAPAWSPERADLVIELCGEIGDEDTSLIDRAEERADRFDEYREHRIEDAARARDAVKQLADGIPFGQPILVGHHSERHARRDQRRIESGMRKAVDAWRTADYWQQRAAGAIRHAKYKQRPDVRARRIKGLEAERRKVERSLERATACAMLWGLVDKPEKWKPREDGSILTREERAARIAERDGYGVAMVRDGQCWSAYQLTRPVEDRPPAAKSITLDELLESVNGMNRRAMDSCARWIEHLDMRLAYERAMLEGDGGTVADRKGPQKGGACKCWASHRGGWSWIVKVNRVSVTVWDNWGNGTRNFTRTIPMDKLTAIMTPAEVEEARAADRLVEYSDGTGFALREFAPPEPVAVPTVPPQDDEGLAADIGAIRDSLQAGVQAVAVDQLFPTPPDVAARMVEFAGLEPGARILEPSAGTGRLLDAVRALHVPGYQVVAVERDRRLAETLERLHGLRAQVVAADFLSLQPDQLGQFDRVVMNPPFSDATDIRHILHARTMLKPGGRLVALCAAGPRQVETLQPLAEHWEDLPAGTFSGTNVRAALLVLGAG